MNCYICGEKIYRTDEVTELARNELVHTDCYYED